jgi:predicted nucleic acid-binding Zn ribbon protein
MFKTTTKNKKCVICGKDFIVLPWNKKTCSGECHSQLVRNISNKQREKLLSTPKHYKCKNCGKSFGGNAKYAQKFCSNTCQYEFYKKNRVGKSNPNFRNGKYTHENFQNRRSKVSYKHLNECRRYRKEFVTLHGYPFCEVCKVNEHGTQRFEVHHIYFASKYPQHKNLHDNKNMILVCIECHQKFHAGKQYHETFLQLEKERGLKKLFIG